MLTLVSVELNAFFWFLASFFLKITIFHPNFKIFDVITVLSMQKYAVILYSSYAYQLDVMIHLSTASSYSLPFQKATTKWDMEIIIKSKNDC